MVSNGSIWYQKILGGTYWYPMVAMETRTTSGYHTIPYRTNLYVAVSRSTMDYLVIPIGTFWYLVIWYGTVRYAWVLYDRKWYSRVGYFIHNPGAMELECLL